MLVNAILNCADIIKILITRNKKINANQVEELLSMFISEKLIEKEANYFKIKLSDNSLSKIIKNQKAFKKENINDEFIFFGDINDRLKNNNILRFY